VKCRKSLPEIEIQSSMQSCLLLIQEAITLHHCIHITRKQGSKEKSNQVNNKTSLLGECKEAFLQKKVYVFFILKALLNNNVDI
jgi:hypothetical protein